MPAWSRRLPVALIGVVLAACAADPAPIVPADADPEPWNEPVEGAVAVTEWRDDGQPGPPFGPGGPEWRHPHDIVEAMASALSRGGVDTVGALASQNASGTVVGWVRLIAADDPPRIARDLRLDLRSDGGYWFVAAAQSRDHCTRPLDGGECR